MLAFKKDKKKVKETPVYDKHGEFEKLVLDDVGEDELLAGIEQLEKKCKELEKDINTDVDRLEKAGKEADEINKSLDKLRDMDLLVKKTSFTEDNIEA